MRHVSVYGSGWKAIIFVLCLWAKTCCCSQDTTTSTQEENRVTIIETVDTDFGEPQVVLNEDSTITRHKIREIQHYMNSHDSWKKTCLNRHQLCSMWAAKGGCTKNAPWMRRHCAASCRRCLLPSRHERDPSDPIFKEAETEKQEKEKDVSPPLPQQSHIMVAISYGVSQVLPTTNADSVVQTIAKMTKYMQQIVNVDKKYATSDCTCKDPLCALWASQGECQTNPSYMNKNCGPVCETCEQLSYEYRCPVDKNAPKAVNLPGDLDKIFERILQEDQFQQFVPSILSSPNNAGRGPWVVQLDNFATEEECERLILLGGQIGYAETKNHTLTGASLANEECDKDSLLSAMLDRVETLLNIPKNNMEHVQLFRYEESKVYGRRHHDYLHDHKDQPQGVRILTLFLYLNHVEDGGETIFPNLDITVTPKMGRAVLWPSTLNEAPDIKDFRTEHEALAVKRGVKYVANVWVHQGDYHQARDKGCV